MKGTITPDFFVSFFGLYVIGLNISRRTSGDELLHIGDTLTDGKKAAKFVSPSPVDSSPRQMSTLPAVLRERNRKSPRTAAHICKSTFEIPEISEMF